MAVAQVEQLSSFPEVTLHNSEVPTMALLDPQTITVSGSAKTLARVQTGDHQAAYQDAAETFFLDVRHITTKQQLRRHEVKMSQRKIVTNPISSVSDYGDLTLAFLISRLPYGFDATEVDALVTAFKTWLTSAKVTELFGSQS
jgi:hypothetical protein